MADQRININIGSSYSGDGFNKALGAVDGLSKKAGKAASAVGSIGSALGGIGGEAGKAIGSITRLTGALAMGGPIGLAIAGVTALIGAFQSYKEKQEEAAKAAKEHAEKLKKLQEEAAKKAWQDFVNDLARGRTEAANMATELQKIITLENQLAAAKQANAAATANLAVAEQNAATAAEVRAANTPEEKAAAQARGNLEIARITGKASIESAQANVNNVASNLEQSEKVYNSLVKTYDSLEQRANELEQSWIEENKEKVHEKQMLEEAYADTLGSVKTDADIAAEMMRQDANFQKNLKAIHDEQEKVNAQIQQTGLSIASLREQQEAAEKKLAAARVQAADAEEEAIGNKLDAEQKIEDIKLEQEIAESNILGALEEQQRAEEEAAQRAEDMKVLDDAIKIAKQDLQNAIKRAQDAANVAAAIAGNGGGGNGGVWNPNGATPGRDRSSGPASNNTDWGNWGTFGKPSGWDQRYWWSHPDEAAEKGVNPGLKPSEQKEFDKLQDMWNSDPERMSDSQIERFKDLRDRNPESQANKAAKDAAKAAEKLKEIEEAKKQREEKMYVDIGEIAAWVKTVNGLE